MILFIGDGMGYEQLKAASLYETGHEEALFIQRLSIQTSVTTCSASDDITDSAAAATAMATGYKIQSGAISVMLPGDGSDLPTILELMLADLQTLVGEAHSRVAALIGDGHLPDPSDGREPDQPSLLEMTESAISLLSQDPDGFFLMVEGGRIDHAAHINDLARMIPEVLELDDVVRAVIKDTALMLDTLVVVRLTMRQGDCQSWRQTVQGCCPRSAGVPAVT